MIAYYAVAAMLWALLAILAFSLVVLIFLPGRDLSGLERAASAAVILLLASPLAIQTISLHRRMHEMRANFLLLDDSGLRVRLTGPFRASKGLPEVPETRVNWNELRAVTRDRRKFLYRSAIPFQYPLDVYTLVTANAAIPFTRECLPGARRAAQAIAARIGQEIRPSPRGMPA